MRARPVLRTSTLLLPSVLSVAACGPASPAPPVTPGAPAQTVAALPVPSAAPAATASETAAEEPAPAPPPGPPPDHVVGIVAAELRACAVFDNGMLQCWGGKNDEGQLGLGHHDEAKTPAWVKGLRGVKKLAVAKDVTCAVAASGELDCWGANTFFGDNAHKNFAAPERVPGLSGVVDVQLSDDHGCAVDGSGAVWCWGRNDWGQLGLGASAVGETIRRPTQVEGVSGAVGVSLAEEATVAWTKGGELYLWGEARSYRRTNGDPSPRKIAFPSPVRRAVHHDAQTCGILDAGEVRCFLRETLDDFVAGKQHDFKPELLALARAFAGKGRFKKSWSAPLTLPKSLVYPDGRGVSGVTDLLVFRRDVMAVTGKGEVYSWGDSLFGMVARAPLAAGFLPPTRVAGLSDVVEIAGTDDTRCALDKSGQVRCFDDSLRPSRGGRGQPGAAQSSAPSPILVSGLPKIVHLAANDACMFALAEDHSLWAWGDPRDHACGIEDESAPAAVPVRVALDRTPP
jgi:hypothetical protein